MNISDETGLPELPAGHYWRIEEDSGHIYDYLRISIMKKRRLARDLDIDYALVRVGPDRFEPQTIERRVLNVAKRLLGEIHERQYRHPLVGDYPPKRLEVND